MRVRGTLRKYCQRERERERDRQTDRNGIRNEALRQGFGICKVLVQLQEK
jgi:hypothetical protein